MRIREILCDIMTHWPKFQRRFPWRNLSDPWAVFLSELLLLQTDATKVSLIYPTIINKIPNPRSALVMGVDKISELLRPLGLYKLRAKWLYNAAKYIVEKLNGVMPVDREDLLKIPGIGEYIASVIAICCGRKASPLDVNIARVLSRIFLGKDPPTRYAYDQVLKNISRQIRWNRKLLYAVLDFAAEICKARRPKCNECPVSKKCMYIRGT